VSEWSELERRAKRTIDLASTLGSMNGQSVASLAVLIHSRYRDEVLPSSKSDLEIPAALVVSTITIELYCIARTFT